MAVEKTTILDGRPAGRPGEIDNKAISAPAKLELGLGLSLAIYDAKSGCGFLVVTGHT